MDAGKWGKAFLNRIFKRGKMSKEKQRKEGTSVRIEPWRKAALTTKYGSVQKWLDRLLEEEFAGSSEVVIVKREEVTEDDF